MYTKAGQQINGPHNAPFAQQLDLGWVIVGDVCIDKAHKPMVRVFKTNILDNDRPLFSLPEPRQSVQAEVELGLKVFDRTENDNKAAMSFEDEIFLKIMQTEFHQN
ncbi:hypothetical protein QTP86_021238 [Hemibagrus guttatus]|nr:hypothetical protein QTP86_021238 [Hemibagrus guttatus]